MRRSIIFGFFAAAVLAASTTNAAEISQTFDIEAAGFDNAAPVDPVSLIFTVQFDNSASFGPTTNGLTVDSFNLPYTSEYEYDQSTDILTIATAPVVTGYSFAPYAGYYTVPNGYGSFIGGASTLDPYSFGFSYETDDGVNHSSATTSVTAGPAVSATPEPSTWILMMAGVGGIGLMLRRARKTMGFRFADALSA